MIGLGARGERRILDLDEVTDVDALAEVGAGPQPRERTDRGARRDGRAFDVGERPYRHSIGDMHALAEDDVWLDHDVAAEHRVCREIDRLGRDHGGTGRERRPAQLCLDVGLDRREVGAGVDARKLGG